MGIRVATVEQVREAIEFARVNADGSLLVHCFHGVGRSAAIALAIIADRLGPGAEREALDHLLMVRPEATPNLVVVELADQILHRSGRLASTVAVWEATVPRLAVARAARLQLAQARPDLYARLDIGRFVQ
ncbi:dual specificity protein phosphatase family protein [Rhizorhabdus dicambivorans]|uniref:dual specificity protein phosphatase family protein n=1 Tax=Rhizorhabdus dicambivorans TaxID=1850238 RepID=UPI0015968F86|nr:dual specificity protein phosphatase family protein [Rhizorhabdus dicambivorans]